MKVISSIAVLLVLILTSIASRADQGLDQDTEPERAEIPDHYQPGRKLTGYQPSYFVFAFDDLDDHIEFSI